MLLPGYEQLVERAVRNVKGELDPKLAVSVDWELVNDEAAEWARAHVPDTLAKGLTEVTRVRVQRVIADWIAQTGSATNLNRAVLEALGPEGTKARAEAIAVTEVTRAYAQVNFDAWTKSGGGFWLRFNSANDARVDDVCRGLHGKVFKKPSDAQLPPIHPRCRCWVQQVAAE